MACGDHRHILEQLASASLSQILEAMPDTAIPEDKDVFLKVWAKGKALIQETLEVKLAFWRSIPHLLVGLAHPSASAASLAARQAIQQWDECADRDAQHRISRLFLDIAGGLREHVHAMGQGVPLGQLPLWFRSSVASSSVN